MAAKAFLVLCASALLVQTISARCAGYGNGLSLIAAENIGYGAGLATAELGYGAGYGAGLAGVGLGGLGGLGSSYGGSFTVSSSSPIAPNGISVLSENAIEGVLLASGALPFLAGVAFEGELATAGQAAVSAGSGNGNVGIVSEGLGGASGLGYGAGLAGNALAGGLGYGAGLANAGLLNSGLASGLVGVGRGGCSCGAVY